MLRAAAPASTAEVDDVHDRLAQLCGVLNGTYAELVTLTARVIDRELWAGGGVRSPEHWLVLRAGLSPARARDIVRLASRARELPSAMAAMADAQLSLDQASVIARHAPATHEAAVTEMAVHATVPQLRRALTRYSFDPDPSAEQPTDDLADAGPTPAERAAAPAELAMGYDPADEGGRFRLTFTAPADLGALVEQALREAKDALFTAGQVDATLADGMVELANRSLNQVRFGDGTATGDERSASRASKYRVYIHLDTGGGWLQKGPALPRHLVDQLTCDGILQPVWETEGSPVNVGRAMRIVPDRTRRLVEDRDRGCRYPGCSTVGFLENHHLDHWRDGGHTTMDRLVSLCPYHHRTHHAGEFAMTGTPSTPDGLVFTSRTGRRLGPSPKSSAREAPREAPSRGVRYRGPTGEQLVTRWVDFGPPVPRPDLRVVRDDATTPA
ncbi:MAG TPA: DUF222 domain-containing protein [Dermatophilaceae bacterium]|nr:DUF222 domain-containing protein [Dermatophilaceae bacterium]